MFRRHLVSTTFKLPYQAQFLFKHQQRFSSSTFTNQRKRFYFDKNTTLSNIESILKKEDTSYQSIVFKEEKTEIQDKSMLFLDAFLRKNLKLEINRQVIPIHIDLNGPAAYLNNTSYDDHLAENEVPIYDALLISNFTKVLQENLEKRHPSKQSFDVKEIQEALNATVQNFKAKGEAKSSESQVIFEELLHEQVKEKTVYDELVRMAQSRSLRILKYAILATIIQWAVLFYLTYYEVGWDVVEPISYLIALAIEGVGIYYYVRYAKSFRQKSIYDMLFKQKRIFTLRTKSVNPEVELNYLTNKINYFTQRVIHSKP